MYTSFIRACFILFVLILSVSAHAAGLGKMTVNSALGQPFNAEIDLVTVNAEDLSSLAEAQLEICLNLIYVFLEHKYGAPISYSEMEQKNMPSRFVIMGLGKLGGRELNFSSDIESILTIFSNRIGLSSKDAIQSTSLQVL